MISACPARWSGSGVEGSGSLVSREGLGAEAGSGTSAGGVFVDGGRDTVAGAGGGGGGGAVPPAEGLGSWFGEDTGVVFEQEVASTKANATAMGLIRSFIARPFESEVEALVLCFQAIQFNDDRGKTKRPYRLLATSRASDGL